MTSVRYEHLIGADLSLLLGRNGYSLMSQFNPMGWRRVDLVVAIREMRELSSLIEVVAIRVKRPLVLRLCEQRLVG
jgi:hypothetical protein